MPCPLLKVLLYIYRRETPQIKLTYSTLSESRKRNNLGHRAYANPLPLTAPIPHKIGFKRSIQCYKKKFENKVKGCIY